MLPLEERRALLAELPFEAPMRRVELLDDADPWDRARRERWEGVIAKRRGSPYEHRRSKHWLKMKCEFSQEFVVGGFTDPQGARVGLGALLVGYYEGTDLVFAGKIGTGFDTSLLLDLRRRLDASASSTVRSRRAVGLPRLRAHWVTPQIVVQASFIEWTHNDKLRHPRLIGVRFDKDPHDVVREHRVITHPEKVLFPDDGITKGEVAAYYEAMAPVHGAAPAWPADHDGAISRRHRRQGVLAEGCLEGISVVAAAGRGPEEGRRRPPSGRDRHGVAAVDHQPEHDHPARVGVAAAGPEHPDLCVFDLDPSNDDVAEVRAAAIGLRDLLEKVGLPSWVKTTGSKGFHIVVPLDGKTSMGAAARFANTVGALFVQPGARQADAGVQQDRPPRPDLHGHGTERLQRDVRRALHDSREAWRAGFCAMHMGGSWNAAP